MCGIAGSISVSGRHHQLTACVQHRGPDDAGEYNAGMVHFEHRRLAIIDLSANGHQPMFSEHRDCVIIFNGEIYNHQVIRDELIRKGYTFKSTSDTETLLYGYLEYGYKILDKLNGIFAFAIHDLRKRQVFIARDQYGIKPLYFFSKPGLLLFASEIKSFLQHPGFDKTPDMEALHHYLQFLYCPTSATPFRYVKRLEPGHYMVINLANDSFGVEEPVRYYDIPFRGEYDNLPEQEWISRLEHALVNAVDRQLLSDVPLGFFLSGGLDSSLIVAIAAKALQKKFTCFTVDAGDDMVKEGFSDDLLYAKKVAKDLRVEIDVIRAVPEILKDFDKMIWHLDEPQADPAAIHVYNISKGARNQGIKVLLGGTAGDDLFSGYRRHQALELEKMLSMTPRFARSSVAAMIGSIPSKNPQIRRLKKISQTLAMEKVDRMASHFKWAPDRTVFQLFHPDVAASLKQDELSIHYHHQLLRRIADEKNDLNRMLYWELKTFLVNHNLNYTDKMSMAASVEARVPYLDVELVNLSTRIPPQLKMKGRETKYLLKKVAEKYLPHDVIYRPKTGFGAPVRKWVNDDLKNMIAERLSAEQIAKRGIFSAKAVHQLIADNASGKTDASYQVFALLAIESWMNQFVDS